MRAELASEVTQATQAVARRHDKGGMTPFERLLSGLCLAATFATTALSSLAQAGCSVGPAARSRLLPQLSVQVRRSRRPDAVVVSASASFPLSGRAGGLPQGAFLDEQPDGALMDDLPPPAFLDELPDGLSVAQGARGPGRVAGARGVPLDLLGPPTEADARSSCRRPDTCAWERVHATRVLAAWGAYR